ncbi:MAG: MFS transporter [Clostridia bacterium]|nr:MFS transporter [Clostridia bacterium]
MIENKQALTDEELAQYGTDEEIERRLHRLVKVDRRVVSRKETIGYMLFDGSTGFNIDGQKELFVDSILNVGLNKQSFFNVFAGIWDVVDDLIIGGLIEKTRTRWGKFVPYIFISGLPLAVVTAVYWLLPVILPNSAIANSDSIPKFLAYMLLEMLMEAISNFKTVATAGYLSTITPYPSDRRRLLAVTKYCNLFYSGLPNTIIEFMLDFITNGIIKTTEKRSSEQMIKLSLVILGPATALVAGLVATWYGTIAKERVHQSVETPKVIDSLKLVFTHKPLLMYMISNAMSSFGTGISTNNYYRWVLFMTTFETIAGIPSVAFQPIGYTKYNSLASRYSTRTLYMASHAIPKACYIPIFFYGLIFKDREGNAFFTKRGPMIPVTAIWECIYAAFSGVTNISNDEIRNECNDYIEWKTGTRNEAMLSVASTIICKIPSRLNSILNPLIKKWIGYDQTAYPQLRPQPPKAQKWIFAMSTLFPAVLSALSILPMFGYRIDKDTRDRMYRELNERRAAKAELMSATEAE